MSKVKETTDKLLTQILDSSHECNKCELSKFLSYLSTEQITLIEEFMIFLKLSDTKFNSMQILNHILKIKIVREDARNNMFKKKK